MNRLSPSSLGDLASAVEIPRYDRRALRPGILHLGVGAFHRAHQAVFTEAALNNSGGDWGIIGVSMRSDTVARQLNPQGGLYSVRSEGDGTQRLQLIGSLLRVIVAPEEPDTLDQLFADPAIRVITLTITEKGYCLGAGGWRLDRKLPELARDLAEPERATTAIGLLARGLHQRYCNGGAPVSIISCDNLSENSARLRSALVEYVEQSFPEILPWLAASVSFPCSMVDRIVPAMTARGRQRQADLLRVVDHAAVATESFSQWLIEYSFAAGVPDWPSAGVQFVADIKPFEAVKLRLLNASHSAIAYTGLLAGKETVADVVADQSLHAFIEQLMSGELMPALDAPAGFDLAHYRDQLLHRFANPALHHRCSQIAMDGTEKIPQRWLQSLRQQRDDCLLLKAMAAWAYFILETELAIEDPRKAQLLLLRDSAGPLAQRLEQLLQSLGLDRENEPLVDQWLERLTAHFGVLASGGLAELVAIQADTAARN